MVEAAVGLSAGLIFGAALMISVQSFDVFVDSMRNCFCVVAEVLKLKRG